jgi:hypothetical protein
MSDERDDHGSAELGAALPAPDLDTTTAERIALRARADLGAGPPKRRWILPIAVGIPATAYVVWTLCQVLDLF